MVIYGHTPVPEAEWLNRTINVDTGCVFGGKLTALRYPEKELVSVAAARTYCEPAKPFLPEESRAPQLTAQQTRDDLLDIEDVIGKRIVTTRLRGTVTIREENATAALEVMSRFATDPKWIIYLPPTMSPCETAPSGNCLEFPAQAFSHYRSAGIPTVVCEEKHMGSRAVVIICRNEEVVRTRFGIMGGGIGVIYTRTGRRFFEKKQLEEELLSHLHAAMDSTGFWDEFQTDWACLDCELMPWSAKAQELLRSQYAAVGASAQAALTETIPVLQQTAARKDLSRDFTLPPGSTARPVDIGHLLARYQARQEAVGRYVVAYRQYCWPVASIEDYKLAPFHLLATEDKVHVDRDHVWHMETLAGICHADGQVLLSTPYKVVNVTEPESEKAGTDWWEQLTGKGGEGMVVKPLQFVVRGKRGLVQPAVKVRGPEYLRIIYGPEYTAPEQLGRLRWRHLGTKRSLALREFALGIESLERFVRREPLRRVHECAFGVLALESEPVDPRL
jgi:protein phosphatase